MTPRVAMAMDNTRDPSGGIRIGQSLARSWTTNRTRVQCQPPCSTATWVPTLTDSPQVHKTRSNGVTTIRTFFILNHIKFTVISRLLFHGYCRFMWKFWKFFIWIWIFQTYDNFSDYEDGDSVIPTIPEDETIVLTSSEPYAARPQHQNPYPYQPEPHIFKN